MNEYENVATRPAFKKLAGAAHKALEEARAGTLPDRYSADTETRILRDAAHYSVVEAKDDADFADITAVVNWTLRSDRAVLDKARRAFEGKAFPIDSIISDWLTPHAKYSPSSQYAASAGGGLRAVATLRNRFNLPLSNWELLGVERVRGELASMDGKVATVDADVTPVLEGGKLTFAVSAMGSGTTDIRLGDLKLVTVTVTSARLLVSPETPKACPGERVSLVVRLAQDPDRPLLNVDVGQYPAGAAERAVANPLDSGGARIELPRVNAPCSLQVTVKDVNPPVLRGVNVSVPMPPDSLRGALAPAKRRLLIAGGATVLLAGGTIWKWLDERDKWGEYEADGLRPDDKYNAYESAYNRFRLLGLGTVVGAAWTGWEYLRYRKASHKFDEFEAWRRENCERLSIDIEPKRDGLALALGARF